MDWRRRRLHAGSVALFPVKMEYQETSDKVLDIAYLGRESQCIEGFTVIHW